MSDQGPYLGKVSYGFILKVSSIALRAFSLYDALYHAARWSSPEAGTFILNFPISRTMRNRFLFFINYPVFGILLQYSGRNQT